MAQLTPNTEPRWPAVFIALGALGAAFSVIASAYATHGTSLNGSSPLLVQTALHFLQFHAVGLILVGLLGQTRPQEKRLQVAGVLFILGSILFSFNILLRAWHDVQAFRALVPWGGTSFILGWLAMGLAFVRKIKPEPVNESGDQTH